jgi:hypothetical protein
MRRAVHHLGLLVLLGAACDRQPAPRANDTAAEQVSLPETASVRVPEAEAPWDTAAGPVFLIMGPKSTEATMVVATIDTATDLAEERVVPPRFGRAAFDLFRGPERVSAVSIAGVVSQDVPEDCAGWPAVTLAGVTDSAAWTVGFVQGRFLPLGVDSISSLPAADSARLSRDLARVASSAPGDTADALRGLPFVVQRAWVFAVDSARTVVLAEITRTLNQEATPLQETLLVIAERDPSADKGLRLAFAQRTLGGEEVLETTEVLAAGLLRSRREPVVLLARYLGDGVKYSLLERSETGRWRMRWTSPYAGC